MEKVNYYYGKDFFGIREAGPAKVKRFNLFLFIIACVFLFIFIFYIIIYSCTNYHQLDELDSYVKTFQSENLSQFDAINLGVKIMPSYNTERNILYMKHSEKYEKTKIPNTQDLMESYELNTTFFRLNHTNKVFPKFKFTKDNIPVGDSVTMCLSANWAPTERGKNFDIMKEVKGFPNCTQAETGKFIWNDEDPTTGVDIPVWIQHGYEADCEDQNCDDYCESNHNGFFVNGAKKHMCYSYDILDGICIVIAYDKVRNEYTYQGGCFEGGKAYMMVPAKLNEVYYFSGIEIEIRDKADPIILAGEMSEYSYSFGNSWRYFAYFLNVLLILNVIFLIVVVVQIIVLKRKIKQSNPVNDLVSGEHNPGEEENNSEVAQ